MARERGKTVSRRGSGSVRKKERITKDGKKTTYYEGRIDVGFSPDGKRIQKSVYGKTQKEVELKLRQISLSSPSEKKECELITVKDLIEEWISGGISQMPSTLRLYSDLGKRYIYPHLGDVPVQSLTEGMVKEWIRKLQNQEYAINKPLSDKSVRDVFSLLKSVLTDAVDKEIILSNPCRRIKLRKPTAGSKKPMMSEKEIQALINELRGAPHERFYLFSMFFGLREMENLGLTMQDIDFERKVIHLRYQLRKDFSEVVLVGETKHFKYLKDHEQRDIYFGSEIEALLKEQIMEEEIKKKELGSAWPVRELERGDLLFSSPTGSYLSYRTIYDCFKRRVKNIGRPDITVHDLRHAYAMLALKSGDSVKTVSEHLGHATPEFTFAIYDYVADEAKVRSANNMSTVMTDFLGDP